MKIFKKVSCLHVSHQIEAVKDFFHMSITHFLLYSYTQGNVWASHVLFAEEALKSLLQCLTCAPFTPTQHLEKEQALAKQFAEILHFTLRFDELKVCYDE